MILTPEVERALAQRQRRPSSGMLVLSPYRAGSWRAQRLLHRSAARWKLLVSGRGVGKTHGLAYETVQIVLSAPVGSEGAVLAPTLQHAEAAIGKLRQIVEHVPNVRWVQSQRRLYLPGGRSIKVFSADRKETVRGPSIVVLWIDEAAYVTEQALTSSLPAIRSVGVKVRLLVSTTPAGKNWVHAWWQRALEDPSSGIERFRFKGTDSPYNDPGVVELARKNMSPEKFAQEYHAEFVDNILLVFPDRDGLFVASLPARKKGGRWMGIDLGKKDFVACVLMNEWCEAEVVGHWNEDSPGFQPAIYWRQSHERIANLCLKHDATAVVDTGGAGGAPGAVLAEYLRSQEVEVVEVKTSMQGTKAQVVEQAQLDVQWKKLKVLENEFSGALDYEMSQFVGIKRQHHGREITIYEGPQVEGEHDDLVISFCLANWGRDRAEGEFDPLAGDLEAFVSTVADYDVEELPLDDGVGWGVVPGSGYSF